MDSLTYEPVFSCSTHNEAFQRLEDVSISLEGSAKVKFLLYLGLLLAKVSDIRSRTCSRSSVVFILSFYLSCLQGISCS